MDQETLDYLSSDISDSEVARLSSMLRDEGGPSMAPHKNVDGSTSMRIMGVNVPMSAVFFAFAGVMLMVAAGRR